MALSELLHMAAWRVGNGAGGVNVTAGASGVSSVAIKQLSDSAEFRFIGFNSKQQQRWSMVVSGTERLVRLISEELPLVVRCRESSSDRQHGRMLER